MRCAGGGGRGRGGRGGRRRRPGLLLCEVEGDLRRGGVERDLSDEALEEEEETPFLHTNHVLLQRCAGMKEGRLFTTDMNKEIYIDG